MNLLYVYILNCELIFLGCPELGDLQGITTFRAYSHLKITFKQWDPSMKGGIAPNS